MFYNKVVNRVSHNSYDTYRLNDYTLADKMYEFKNGKLCLFQPKEKSVCDRWKEIPKVKNCDELDFKFFM